MFREDWWLNMSFGKILQLIFAGLLLVIALGLVGWFIRWLFLPTQVLDPQEGLARWQWFYDEYEAVNAVAGNIQVASNSVEDFKEFNGSPDTWDWQQNDEYQRLVTVRDGYITQYNNLANSYNAKMRDMTRNWSAPPDLPSNIPNWGSE